MIFDKVVIVTDTFESCPCSSPRTTIIPARSPACIVISSVLAVLVLVDFPGSTFKFGGYFVVAVAVEQILYLEMTAILGSGIDEFQSQQLETVRRTCM